MKPLKIIVYECMGTRIGVPICGICGKKVCTEDEVLKSVIEVKVVTGGAVAQYFDDGARELDLSDLSTTVIEEVLDLINDMSGTILAKLAEAADADIIVTAPDAALVDDAVAVSLEGSIIVLPECVEISPSTLPEAILRLGYSKVKKVVEALRATDLLHAFDGFNT